MDKFNNVVLSRSLYVPRWPTFNVTFRNRHVLLLHTLIITRNHRLSDLQHGLSFDCNQDASLVRGARAIIDFNYIAFSDDY